MNNNDDLLIKIAQDVAEIRGKLNNYPEIVTKTNDNEARSKSNEKGICDLKSSQKWLYRLVSATAITWILSQVFELISRG